MRVPKTRKAQKNKLDKLFSEKIAERDKECQLCGSFETLNTHHIVGRRNHYLRWDLSNGILLCSGCHTFKTNSAHQNPRWFQEWFAKKYPQRNKYLRENENKIKKWVYEDELEKLK